MQLRRETLPAVTFVVATQIECDRASYQDIGPRCRLVSSASPLLCLAAVSQEYPSNRLILTSFVVLAPRDTGT